MKVRSGFVSNSSSASFVVKFSSSHDADTVQRHLNLMLDGNEWARNKVYNKLVPKGNGEYSILTETGMFNDWYDITEWPFIKMLADISPNISGYKLIEIRKTEEEYNDCDKVVEFDSEPWDAYYVTHRNPDMSDAEHAEEIKEYNDRMFEYEGRFLSFLYGMDLPIDNKLLLLDYKFSK